MQNTSNIQTESTVKRSQNNSEWSYDIEEAILEILKRLSKITQELEIDERDPDKTKISMEVLLLCTLISGVRGKTDCSSIRETIRINWNLFIKDCPKLRHLEIPDISEDTIRRILYLMETEKFSKLLAELTNLMIVTKDNRIIAADGQAGRATRINGKPYYIMNFYDTTNQIILYQVLIPAKNNEITVGPPVIDKIDVKGATVTADAMNCQKEFIAAIIKNEGQYCVAVKRNHQKLAEAITEAFERADSSKIIKGKTEVELGHGRIETREVSILPATELPQQIVTKWAGLETGSIVLIKETREEKIPSQKSIMKS